MMVLPKELETEIKEKLRHVSKPFDLIPIWKLAGKNMHPIDARDCFSCYRRYENPPEAFFEHLTSFSVEEKEWRHRLDESTDPQEIIELSKKLEMDMDIETAEILADCNRSTIELREENGSGDVVQEIEEMLVKWMATRDKKEFIAIGLQLDSDATEEEMAELFDKLRDGHLKGNFKAAE